MARKSLGTRRQRTTEKWVDETYARAVEKIRRVIREKLTTLPRGSTLRVYLESLLGLPPERLLQEISSRAHPNSTRVGCPPYRVLMELATRTRGLSDPVFEHIERCHPCSVELRTLVRAYKPPDPS
jgi:hypothetical protein